MNGQKNHNPQLNDKVHLPLVPDFTLQLSGGGNTVLAIISLFSLYRLRKLGKITSPPHNLQKRRKSLIPSIRNLYYFYVFNYFYTHEKKLKSYKIPLSIFLFSFSVAVAPLISVLLSIIIAKFAGCTVHEGYENYCQIGSINLGNIIYSMYVAGWYIFYSLPLGLLGLIIGLVWFVVILFKS